MNDCTFCRIVKKEIPCYKIYENNLYLGFLDSNPIVEGHVLLIPKIHYETIFELGEEETKNLGTTIKEVTDIFYKTFGSNINIVNTNGQYASQSVPHFHLHFIPRKKGDRLWDREKSKIVLDRSSGFERLKLDKKELENILKKMSD